MKFFLPITLLLVCFSFTEINAQNSPTKHEIVPAEATLSKGLINFESKNYSEAIKLLQEYLSYNPSNNFAAFAYYYVGCSYAQIGQKDSALHCLNLAGEKGFAEWQQALKEPTLEVVRKFPAFAKAVDSFKNNAISERIYQVTQWDNASLGWASLHYFSDYTHSKAKKLRQLYRLDTLLIGKTTQLQKQIAVMGWVHNLWVHDIANICPSLDALTILQQVKEGKRFRCVEYSVVLSQALKAVGFPARAIELHKEGMSFGVGKGHAVTEVWNDDLGKWILLDPQNNAVWKKKDTILNAVEIRQILLSKDTALTNILAVDLYPSRWRDNRFNLSDWMEYFYYLSFRYKNQLLENPEHPKLEICLLAEGQKPELLCQGLSRQINYTNNSKKIYPILNRVHIDVSPEALSYVSQKSQVNSIICELSNNAPWFDHYVISVNGVTSVQKSSSFKWKLNLGVNKLEISAVNKAGVVGAPSNIEIIYHPPKS